MATAPAPVVFNYGVSYSASTTGQGSEEGPGGASDSWTTTSQWSGAWPDLSVRVSYGTDGKVAIASSGAKAAKGAIHGSYSYTFTGPTADGSQNGTVNPNPNPNARCAGQLTQSYPASVGIQDAPNGPVNSFGTNAAIQPAWATAWEAFMRSSCPTSNPLPLEIQEGQAESGGSQLVASNGVGFVDYAGSGLGLTLPKGTGFPLSQLASGRTFVLRGGPWTDPWPLPSTQGVGGLSASVTDTISVTFTPSSKKSGSSGGATVCHVPLLKDRTLASTRRLLKAAGCRLGKVTTTSARPQSTLHVTTQSPKAGAIRPHGSPVNIVLG